MVLAIAWLQQAPGPDAAAAARASRAKRAAHHHRHPARRSGRRLRLRGGADAGDRALAARRGAIRARYSAAPITLTSHATIMTGRYPPGHGARHNGMRMRREVPRSPTRSQHNGFATARSSPRFRSIGGSAWSKASRPTATACRAAPTAASRTSGPAGGRGRGDRLAGSASAAPALLPVGAPVRAARAVRQSVRRPAGAARYDDEIAESGSPGRCGCWTRSATARRRRRRRRRRPRRGVRRARRDQPQLFVYDTTLRVPLIDRRARASPPARASTTRWRSSISRRRSARRLGVARFDADGIDLDAGARADGSRRSASSTPRRSRRCSISDGARCGRCASGGFKFIAAPKPELFQVTPIPGRPRTSSATDAARAALDERVDRISARRWQRRGRRIPKRRRGCRRSATRRAAAAAGGTRPDPKDRRDLAARLAQVTSGELTGEALRAGARADSEGGSAQPAGARAARLRAARARQCPAPKRISRRPLPAQLPGADALLGLASCQAAARQFAAAATRWPGRTAPNRTTRWSSPTAASCCRTAGGPPTPSPSSSAPDPGSRLPRGTVQPGGRHLRAGQRAEAAREAAELLRRLPPEAPQRPEVERLLASRAVAGPDRPAPRPAIVTIQSPVDAPPTSWIAVWTAIRPSRKTAPKRDFDGCIRHSSPFGWCGCCSAVAGAFAL